MSSIILTIQLIITPVVSPLFIGIVRKIKARLQNREGSSIFQPYKDLSKLFKKDEVVSKDASWIFKFSPYVIFSISLIIGASIPIFTNIFVNNLLSDLLVVIYLITLGTFFLVLSGIDIGGPFGGLGSSREMTLASLTEGGLLFSFMSLAFLSHSTNLFNISKNIYSQSIFSFTPIVLAFLAFIIAMLSETSRFPFDNPSTHLELTMIHEAMILEYSGKRLALMEWASANKFFIFLSLGANLFFPWGMYFSLGVASLLISFLLCFLKILTLAAFVAILESSIAKFRFFRLPDLLFTSFILSVIAISLIV